MRQKRVDLILGLSLTMAAATAIGLTGTCAARLAPIDTVSSILGTSIPQTEPPSAPAESPPAVAPLSRRFPLDPDWKAPETSPVVAAAAVGSPGDWLDPEKDYPVDARRAGHEGTSGIGFIIGTDGRASDCHILQSSGDASLDDSSCEIVQNKARYRPARDAKGEAVAVGSTLRITWRLEQSGREPLNERLITTSVTISPSGALSDCTARQDFDGKIGVPQAVPCSTIIPQATANYLYNLVGTGSDLRVELEAGNALSDAIMAKRVADRAGWRTIMLTSVWWKVSETGEASDCQIAEKRSSGYAIPDLCQIAVGPFFRLGGKEGPAIGRLGRSVAIFAQPIASRK